MGAQKSRPDAASTSSLTQAADLHIRNYFEALDNSEPPSGLYDRILEEVERPLIIRTLHLTRGNQIKAAQILGLNRNSNGKKKHIFKKNINDCRPEYAIARPYPSSQNAKQQRRWLRVKTD